MSISEAQKKAVQKYKEKNIKRIPLDVQINMYNEIKETAEKLGCTVNGYIKNAIKIALEKDKNFTE